MLIKSFWSFSLWLSWSINWGRRWKGMWVFWTECSYWHRLLVIQFTDWRTPPVAFLWVHPILPLKNVSQLLNPKFRHRLVTWFEWAKKPSQNNRNLWISADWIVEKLILSHGVNNSPCEHQVLMLRGSAYLQICLAQCVSCIEVTLFSAACIKCSFL